MEETEELELNGGQEAVLRGVTMSDLHLFADRVPLSSWEEPKRIWREHFDLCVLNGDVFDFRWARLRASRAEVTAAAAAWLEDLLSPPGRCRFVVLMGNHDAHPSYGELLDSLAARHKNLIWGQHWFVLGPKLFCHGDMPDLTGELENLLSYRRKHAHHPPASRFGRAIYASATRMGVTGAMPRVLPWRRQCVRIDVLMRAQLGEAYQGITDVYVGHTHVHFLNRECRGKRFHNGGAPLPGGRFVPLAFSFQESELEAAWKAGAV